MAAMSEDQNIDLSLDNLKRIYPITSTFKTRQKGSSGRLLPYEAIDKTMYKNNGNCVCFITSEKRMHAWLKAVAHILYYDLGNKPNNNVIWRDRTEKSSIVHTEFI